MPTKKKTAKVTAKFSANVPEEMISKCGTHKKYRKWGAWGALYFFGMIGAAIYFIAKATGLRMGVLGLLKAFVRPIFLVHGLLKFLGI